MYKFFVKMNLEATAQ